MANKGTVLLPRSAKVAVKQELYFLPSSSCTEALANVVQFEQTWQGEKETILVSEIWSKKS